MLISIYNKVPLSISFDHFLDFLAEILTIFSLHLWKILDTKIRIQNGFGPIVQRKKEAFMKWHQSYCDMELRTIVKGPSEGLRIRGRGLVIYGGHNLPSF